MRLSLLQLPYTRLIPCLSKKLVSTHLLLRNVSISVCKPYPHIGCIVEETIYKPVIAENGEAHLKKQIK